MNASTIVDWAIIVALLTLLWLLISIPAYALLNGWRRIGTDTPKETGRFFMSHVPAFSGRYTHFQSRLASIFAPLDALSVRAVIDRKHRRLRRDLGQMRAVIDRRLQQISAASTSRGGGTLIDMLSTFRAETERALEFGTLEDGFVDNSVARAKARFGASVAIAFALIITAANFGLLYLFFDEFFAGLRVPYLGIQLAVILAIIFPLVEAAGGVLGEMLGHSNAGSSIKVLGVSAVLMCIAVLGALEFVIFYQLLGGLFASIEAFPRDGLMHKLVSLAGSALTALEALCGYIATRNLIALRELNAHVSIRDQVSDARSFVDSLEARYDQIDRAAATAIRSVDELAAQLRGRGEAELPVATALSEQRERFRGAIDEVNPERWINQVPAANADRDAVMAQACLLPLLVIAGLLLFAFGAGSVAARSDLTGINGFSAGFLVALASSAACFIAGAHLFDRTTLSYASGTEWRDAVSPRDSAFRAAAFVVLTVASLGTIWLCVDVDGWLGLAEGLLLIAILLGLAIAGSYQDLAARGLVVLTKAFILTIAFLLVVLGLIIWAAALLMSAVVAITAHAILALVAWPLAWALSLRQPRQRHVPVVVT